MSHFNDYAKFKNEKNTIVGLINESAEVVNDISLTQYAEGLNTLSKKVDSDSFKIQIVGTFKNGKSTFINALLGEDILPSKVLPCTAVINEVKYGDTKKAILHFRNPLPETLLSDIPEATLAHMKKHGMTNVPPMEIEYDRIEDYVTIPINGDPEEISLKSPYLSVELFYPSPLLKEGVEIIDSPGLNENSERTAVTMEYLDKADAIIFLLDATKACSQDEMSTIEDYLLPKGFDDIFFVVNRFDAVAERERADVKLFVEKNVKEYTTNPVYCLSALQGLKGKEAGDESMLEQSGLPAFEARLSEFLTKDKGRFKLTKPAKELKHIITTEALYKAIPSQRAQLNTDMAELRRRYEAIQPELIRVESQKEALRKDLELKVERKESVISQAIVMQFREVANMVPAWVEAFQPKTDPGVFGRRRQVEAMSDEITKHVSAKVKETFGKWNTDVLAPMVVNSAAEIFESTDDQLKEIFNDLDKLQSELAGTENVPDSASGWFRAIGVAGAWIDPTGASMALASGQFDMKIFAQTLGVNVGILAGMGLLGLTNPVILLGGLIAVIWNSILGGKRMTSKKVKEDMTSLLRNSIVDGAAAKAAEIVGKIDTEFQKSIDMAITAIDTRIADLKSQIEAILAEKEKGEASTTERMELLARSEQRLQGICTKLDSFLISLIEK